MACQRSPPEAQGPPDHVFGCRKPRAARAFETTLAIFFLLGSVMAHFIWHTMSGFLAGQPVEGGSYLLALAVTGLFFGLAWLLGLYIQSTLSSD